MILHPSNEIFSNVPARGDGSFQKLQDQIWVLKQTAHSYFHNFRCPWQGWRNLECWGDIAPPIFPEGGKILAFSNPNISGLKEGVTQRIH